MLKSELGKVFTSDIEVIRVLTGVLLIDVT